MGTELRDSMHCDMHTWRTHAHIHTHTLLCLFELSSIWVSTVNADLQQALYGCLILKKGHSKGNRLCTAHKQVRRLRRGWRHIPHARIQHGWPPALFYLIVNRGLHDATWYLAHSWSRSPNSSSVHTTAEATEYCIITGKALRSEISQAWDQLSTFQSKAYLKSVLF